MIKKFENFEKEETCEEHIDNCMFNMDYESESDDDEKSDEFNEKKKWIQDAIKNPGALKKSLDKGKDEKISKKEIESELSKLKKKDKDKEKPGTQLNKKDATKKRRLELAKTLSKLKSVKENNSDVEHYMFFSNLETIKRLADRLLEMDKHEIDEMLKEHDWASDHITSSKDDIEEVFNFIYSHNDPEGDNVNQNGNTFDELFDNPLSHIDSFISHTKK
jgi:hypothetical protein